MSTLEYFRHCRTLADGRIGAAQCLRMAREASALDRTAAMRRYTPSAACNEVLPDGSGHMRLSFSIKVY